MNAPDPAIDSEPAAVDLETEVDRKHAEIDFQADADLYLLYQQALYDVAKGSVDRVRSAAEVVQKAAAAVGTIYAAALGLSFSAAERPLPAHALVPALFLGVSLASSTVYLAFLTPGDSLVEAHSSGVTRLGARQRLQFFLQWTNAIAQRRVTWLRASVVALSVGVAALPMPFVRISDDHASTGSEIDWPSQPTGGDDAVNSVLYEAQVAEVAAQRQEMREAATTTPDTEGTRIWWALGAAGALVVVVGARRGSGRRS